MNKSMIGKLQFQFSLFPLSQSFTFYTPNTDVNGKKMCIETHHPSSKYSCIPILPFFFGSANRLFRQFHVSIGYGGNIVIFH